jgi:hypothetical protein
LEWRCENYIYAPKGQNPMVDYRHGNTHLTSLWHQDLIKAFGGRYPYEWAGGEDQMFNQKLHSHLGYPKLGDRIPDDDIFYIYRWGVGKHWSGPGGNLQDVYEELADDPVVPGTYTIKPHWQRRYNEWPLTAIREATKC